MISTVELSEETVCKLSNKNLNDFNERIRRSKENSAFGIVYLINYCDNHKKAS